MGNDQPTSPPEFVFTVFWPISTSASPWFDPSADTRKSCRTNSWLGTLLSDPITVVTPFDARIADDRTGKFCRPFAPVSGSSVSLAVTPDGVLRPAGQVDAEPAVPEDLVRLDRRSRRGRRDADALRAVSEDDVADHTALRPELDPDPREAVGADDVAGDLVPVGEPRGDPNAVRVVARDDVRRRTRAADHVVSAEELDALDGVAEVARPVRLGADEVPLDHVVVGALGKVERHSVLGLAEMTFRAPVTDPPMTLADPSTATPLSPLPSAAVPVTSVPMKFPWTVTPDPHPQAVGDVARDHVAGRCRRAADHRPVEENASTPDGAVAERDVPAASVPTRLRCTRQVLAQ